MARKKTTKEITSTAAATLSKRTPKAMVSAGVPSGNFDLNNNLLTIRYWSNSYTTSLFDKKVLNYTLVCQFPLSNFNLDVLKNINAAQVYLDISGKVYIARISSFIASVTPEVVIMQLALANLRLKARWDMEFATPSVMYEQILSDKEFFRVGGKKLDDYVKPLGLSRKTCESDQAYRRRTIEYLNFKMSSEDNSEEVSSLLSDIQRRGEDDAR